MFKRLPIALGVLLAVVAVVALVMRPDRTIRLASGSVSQNICSKTFVTGQPPDEVYAQDMRPEGGMGLIAWALNYAVDHEKREVTTTIAGLFETRSIYRDGYGCVREYEGFPTALPPPTPTPPDETARLHIELTANTGVQRAVEAAFEEPESGPRRWTQAAVVVHDGRVIAERYAPRFNADTPLLSHSIAKSVMNALVAILVREGKLAVADKTRVAAWRTEGDPRAAITVDQLLRMSSGLPLDEGMGPGRSQQMWFAEPDNAKYAETSSLVVAPGTAVAYSNQGYAVLSRIVADTIGGGPQGVAEFAQAKLFAPLGMRNVTMEFDAAGTPMGGNAVFASAHDWARFGLLYLNDGVVNGRRILPEGWAAYSARQTLASGYGAGFWLNVTDANIEPWNAPWGLPGAPRDSYFARGYLGQYVIVIPSERLVIVRFGVSHGSMGDIKGVGALVRDIVAALHAS